MLDTTTVQLRLYLRSTAVALSLEALIRDVAIPTDAPSNVPLWHAASFVLPYVDLQYGTDIGPMRQANTLWENYQKQVHSVWMRLSPSDGKPDQLQMVTPEGAQVGYQVKYRFDRVRVEWTDDHGKPEGVTQQRLRHPGIYTANNTRLPLEGSPTRYGTRTTPCYGRRVTANQVFTQFEAVPAVLRGEKAHPKNTRRIMFSYGRHLVRVLYTVRDSDGVPYWYDFTLDDWENADNIPWQDYHNHYCGLQ